MSLLTPPSTLTKTNQHQTLCYVTQLCGWDRFLKESQFSDCVPLLFYIQLPCIILQCPSCSPSSQASFSLVSWLCFYHVLAPLSLLSPICPLADTVFKLVAADSFSHCTSLQVSLASLDFSSCLLPTKYECACVTQILLWVHGPIFHLCIDASLACSTAVPNRLVTSERVCPR